MIYQFFYMFLYYYWINNNLVPKIYLFVWLIELNNSQYVTLHIFLFSKLLVFPLFYRSFIILLLYVLFCVWCLIVFYLLMYNLLYFMMMMIYQKILCFYIEHKKMKQYDMLIWIVCVVDHEKNMMKCNVF